MSDPHLHLKMDRVLAGQEGIKADVLDYREALAALIVGMNQLGETIGIQTETLVRLADAMSKEGDDTEMRLLLQRLTLAVEALPASIAEVVQSALNAKD